MLKIKESTTSEQLRKLSVYLNADFYEELGAVRLALENENGKGCISSYDLFPGLAVQSYNITLTREVRFIKEESKMNPLYFLYGIEGHYFHKFGRDKMVNKIAQMQNIILTGGDDETNTIILPADVPLKMSVILLMKDALSEAQLGRKNNLWQDIFKLSVKKDVQDSFKYMGDISPRIASSAQLLIENRRTDIVGRLLVEGAVFNTMAAQIDGYNKRNDVGAPVNIRKEDLAKIVDIASYIKERIGHKLTVEDLSRHIGMGPGKLQSGVQHIFGETVNNLIVRMKMEYARELLLNSTLSISEIVYAIGLSSRSYFSKKFRIYYGVVPSVFRKKIHTKESVFELSYHSVANADITEKDIELLVEHSKIENREKHITGCLVHYQGFFFQVIEGPKVNVLELYHKITKDKRHSDVKLIWKGVRVDRTFKDWHLAKVTDGGTMQVLEAEEFFDDVDVKDVLKGLDETSVATDILWKRISDKLKVAG